MKKMKTIISVIIMTIGIGLAVVPVQNVGALALFPSCTNNSTSTICADKDSDATSMVKVVVNGLLFMLGIVSVVMIIYAGILYTTSAGDNSKLTKAKNTLLYSVVGLVVASLSYAIVNFVVKLF